MKSARLAVMPYDKDGTDYRHWFWLMTAFALAQFFFAAVPRVDIWVSALFYSPEHGGFWLNRDGALQVLRDIILWVIVLPCLIAMVLWPVSTYKRQVGRVPPAVWRFIVALYAAGPVFLVNGVLKRLSGRARPAQIQEFGGTREFSPAFEIADQCERNCSFVSGEGSAAVVFCISAIVLIRYLPFERYHGAMRVLVLTVAALGLFLRVAKGRHFLSDSLFAILIMLVVACVIHQLSFSRSLFRRPP